MLLLKHREETVKTKEMAITHYLTPKITGQFVKMVTEGKGVGKKKGMVKSIEAWQVIFWVYIFKITKTSFSLEQHALINQSHQKQ